MKLPGTPDIAFVRARVAVFVDGCFWHGCPEHYTSPKTNTEFWAEKIATNRARDERVQADLSAEGWTTVRLWEHQVIRDVEGAADVIVDLLNQRR